MAEGFIGDSVARNSVNIAPIAVFRGGVASAFRDGTALQDGLRVVRTANGEDTSRFQDGSEAHFEYRDTTIFGENVDSMRIISFVQEGVKLDEALGNIFCLNIIFGNVDCVVASSFSFAFPSAQEVSACGSAIDNGVQIASVDINFLSEHIHLDGVLARSRNEDGIIQNLENVDSDSFSLDEMLVLGERTAIFGSAHFTGLHFDGDNAVDEDLRVGVRFLFGHVFVIDTATCGLNQALEHIFQKGLGNFRFGTNAVNGRRVIWS